MPEITTDQEILLKKSEPANDLEVGDIVQQLSISIPSHALGLAAPQISIHKRVFLANLFMNADGSSSAYAFVNPEITWTSSDKIPSEESCLSLPGIRRCVERYSQVSITCDKLINLKTSELEVEPEPIRLKDRDSFVVQHEIDHLNGVLLVNLPHVMTQGGKLRRKEMQRNERIEKARHEKRDKLQKVDLKPQKLSAKKQEKKKREAKKAKRRDRTARRQEKIRVEIQEKYAAEKEGLFSNDASPTSEAIDKPEQD